MKVTLEPNPIHQTTSIIGLTVHHSCHFILKKGVWGRGVGVWKTLNRDGRCKTDVIPGMTE